MAVKYVTLADMVNTIRKNLVKIPRDIDFIVGIPRSGMIAASIISSYLNIPLTDINSLAAGLEPYGGDRLRYFNSSHTGKALVVDDTVWSGSSKKKARRKLANVRNVKFIFMAVYLEGPNSETIDMWLEDVRGYTDNFQQIVLYEWNIMQHHASFTKKFLFDIDGVFCPDPPDERKTERYISYIRTAPPLFIPRSPIGGIITYRFGKFRDITENWLRRQGIQYNELIMFEHGRRDESPQRYKGIFYREHDYNLLIESCDSEAQKIAEIAGKPVYCVESNKMYQ